MFTITKCVCIILQIIVVLLLWRPVVSGYRFISIFERPDYDEILEDLYLGNALAAYEPRILTYLNITHILTIDIRPIPKHIFYLRNISNLYIEANDHPDSRLIPYFPISNEFIEEGINEGGILVHCHHGISRSATLVIAYIMEKYNVTYDQAFRYVRSKRKFIKPNQGFERQLRHYYDKNFKVKSKARFTLMHHKSVNRKRNKFTSAIMYFICSIVPLAVIA